jgi:septum formation protein
MSINVGKKLILASASPRRQELIRSLRLPYEIRVSDVNEDTEPGLNPQQIVEQLSARKAEAVCDMYRSELPAEGIVIGSDTIVVLDGEVLGKPRDERDAFRMLSALQGRVHQVYSGVACRAVSAEGRPMDRQSVNMQPAADNPANPAGASAAPARLGDIGQYRIWAETPGGQPELIVGHTVSTVTFRPMTEEEIRAYIQTEEPLDKAGSYGVQGAGAVFIEKIEGDFYSIMGLPLNLLYQMLLKFGISALENR